MSKKYGTKKGKEEKIPERELIGGKFYLIDEEKCLYGELNGDNLLQGGGGKDVLKTEPQISR